MAFGSFREGEAGTYFIGYCATPEVTEQMLRNMFLGDEEGNQDRILDFSTAVTGGLFFVPAKDFLDDPPPAPGEDSPATDASPDSPAADPAPPARPRPTDGSLGLGSLKRS